MAHLSMLATESPCRRHPRPSDTPAKIFTSNGSFRATLEQPGRRHHHATMRIPPAIHWPSLYNANPAEESRSPVLDWRLLSEVLSRCRRFFFPSDHAHASYVKQGEAARAVQKLLLSKRIGAMVAVSAGVFLCGAMISYSGIVATSSGMVELRKRKKKQNNDDNFVAPTSSQSDDAAVSDDDVEEEPKSKSKRKKEGVVTKSKKKSTESSGPHACRFCSEVFAQSQALGGHMNKHRAEKEQEEVQKARDLIAKKQSFTVGNSWNMPGSVDGNLYSYSGIPLGNPSSALGTSSRMYFNYANQSLPSSLQNLQMNQQNVHFGIPTTLQGGDRYHYNLTDNTRSQAYGLTSHRNANPIGQYQAQHGLGVNSGQQYPVQTVYSDSNPVLHGGTHAVQPQYGSLLHSNQGELQDVVNVASNSQQGQTNISMAPFMRYQPSSERTAQFVDEHGNPVPDHQGGHNFQMPQDYNQSPLDQRPNMSGNLIRSESSGIGSEHNQPGHGVYGMSSLDAGQEFQGGTDHHENTALMESGQAGFETDASIDDHTPTRLP